MITKWRFSLISSAALVSISIGLAGCGGGGDAGIDEGIDAGDPVLVDDVTESEGAIEPLPEGELGSPEDPEGGAPEPEEATP